MLTKNEINEFMENVGKQSNYTESIYCKSHDIKSINKGLDYVEFSGRVIFENSHDVEIGFRQFSDAIKKEAEKRGMEIMVISRRMNDWIHEGVLMVLDTHLWKIR